MVLRKATHQVWYVISWENGIRKNEGSTWTDLRDGRWENGFAVKVVKIKEGLNNEEKRVECVVTADEVHGELRFWTHLVGVGSVGDVLMLPSKSKFSASEWSLLLKSTEWCVAEAQKRNLLLKDGEWISSRKWKDPAQKSNKNYEISRELMKSWMNQFISKSSMQTDWKKNLCENRFRLAKLDNPDLIFINLQISAQTLAAKLYNRFC